MNNGFNIICRNGKYYFRARVPAKLASKIGIREIKKSLNTTNLTEARRRARPLQNFVSELKVMSNMDDILKQLRNAGVDTDRLTHKIKRLSIGDLLIEGLEVDPNNEADIEATERVIKAAATNLAVGTRAGTNKPLKDGITAYIEEMIAGKNWSERTLAENRGIYNFLLKMIGEDITCNQITHETARTVKNLLIKLPSNFEKKAKYKGKTIAQVIALNDEPRTISTVNKTLIRYSSLFSYLKKNGYVAENVFANITIKQRKNVKEERRPFTEGELNKLFTHLSEKKLKHAYQRFVPLIALYSGMRLEEICQLYKTDIKQTSCGVWYFDITTIITTADDQIATNDIKQLKNETSKRQVPLHPVLTSLNLGFLDYIDSVRGDRLFPELKKISHRYSHAASRWFTDTRRKLGLVVPKGQPLLDFHSFRHNISTQLTHKDMPEYVIAGLLGQTYGKSESGRRYAKVPPPEHSINYLEKLHFDIPI